MLLYVRIETEQIRKELPRRAPVDVGLYGCVQVSCLDINSMNGELLVVSYPE